MTHPPILISDVVGKRKESRCPIGSSVEMNPGSAKICGETSNPNGECWYWLSVGARRQGGGRDRYNMD